jgi:hypothetical protein
MTTIPDSVKAQLDADWTGAGGTEPDYYVEEDYRTEPPLGDDVVLILSGTLKTDTRPLNDTYADHYHTIDLVVSSKTSEDRLKELSDEVVRILNATAIANINYQRITNRKRVTTKYQNLFVYQEIVTVDLREFVSSSASAYGTGTTGDFAVVGNLTVGGTASITGVTTFTDETLTSTQIADLLMFGSANAAWVPMVMEGGSSNAHWYVNAEHIINATATDLYYMFRLPLPPTKGSLKLYISGVRVGIDTADADDYISEILMKGDVYDTTTNILLDSTNYNSSQRVENTFAAHDCSGYDTVHLTLLTFVTDAAGLKTSFVTARCYYDT